MATSQIYKNLKFILRDTYRALNFFKGMAIKSVSQEYLYKQKEGINFFLGGKIFSEQKNHFSGHSKNPNLSSSVGMDQF